MVPKEPNRPTDPINDDSPQMGKDPITGIFGIGGSGFSHTPEEDTDTVPDEVQAIIEEYDINMKKGYFTAVLKKCQEGYPDTQGAYVNSYRGTAPTLKEIALNYGPGRYLIVLQWRADEYDENKGKRVVKNKSESVNVIIDEAFRDAFEEFQLDKKLLLTQRKREKIQKAKISATLDKQLSPLDEEEGSNKKESVRDYVMKFAEEARALGFQRGNGFDIEKIIPLAIPVLGFLKEQSEANRARQDQFMMLMIQSMNQSTNQLVEIMKSQNGPSNGSEMMKELTNMVMSGIDLRKTIEESNQKETVVDKVFNLIEGVAPVIVQLAAMPKERAKSNPLYGIAQQTVQTNPEINEVMKNPEYLRQLVDRLDPQLGTAQVDRLLEMGGETRPAECMENYNKFPSAPPGEEEQTENQ